MWTSVKAFRNHVLVQIAYYLTDSHVKALDAFRNEYPECEDCICMAQYAGTVDERVEVER